MFRRKWLATCFVHWNGAFIACAQAAGKWLKCLGPPSSSIALMNGGPSFLRKPVEKQIFAERSLQSAFGAGAIVAGNVDDQGIVAIGQLWASTASTTRLISKSHCAPKPANTSIIRA